LTDDQVAAHYTAAAFADTSALTSTVKVTDPAGAVTSKMYDALHGMRTVSATDTEGARDPAGSCRTSRVVPAMSGVEAGADSVRASAGTVGR